MRGCIVLGVLGVLVVVMGWAGEAAADSALDKPAFTATPAELLAAAAASPAPSDDSPQRTLRDERDASFDAQGRTTRRWRRVYVVRARSGSDHDGNGDETVHAVWRPSYQDPPELRARVISPGGEVAVLDLSQIQDAQVPGSRGTALVDRHVTTGTLPAVAIGSVVEAETVTRDREPALGGGSAVSDGFVDAGAVVSYSVPAGRALHRVERQLPRGIHARHVVTGGRERWSYELPAEPDPAAIEAGVPGDVVTVPYVGATTAASWSAVARAYRAILERRIADGPVALPADLPHAPSRAAIDEVAGWLRARVRHDGLDFRDAPYTPAPPAAVLARGTGSGTELATLLAALLRQAGIRADLALISGGPGRDVDTDLPGMVSFDHAIVRARLAREGDVWIDPTAALMVPGQLPTRDQGRRALVIADDTARLVATPLAAAGDNVSREVHSFIATELGPSTLTLVTQGTGVFDARNRAVFQRPVSARDKAFAEYVTQRFGGTVTRATSTAAADLATPFSATIEIKDANTVYTNRQRIDIDLPTHAVFWQVPAFVRHKPPAGRSHDFAWPLPHVIEFESRIALPPGFAPPAAPPDRIVALGPATFSERRRVDGQTLIVTLRFDAGKPRMSAAELTALEDALPALENQNVHITIHRTAFALREDGKYRASVAEDERMVALHPGEAIHRAQLAEALAFAGDGDAARREARAAFAMAPNDPTVLLELGWVLHRDRLGRDFRHDWDRPAALEVLRKARAIAPDDVDVAIQLARVLERDAAGVLFGPGADLSGAIAAWRAAYDRNHDEVAALGLARALIWSGQPGDAEAVARSAPVDKDRDLWIVTAIGDAQGAPAAIKAAGELRSGDERTQLINWAVTMMLVRQRYDLARALAAETRSAGSPTTWDAVVAQLTTHPDVAPGSRDPRTAVTDLFLALGDRARKTPVFWDAIVERDVRNSLRWYAPAPTSYKLRAERFLGDVLQSASVKLDAGDGVWHARVTGPWKMNFAIYLVLDGGIAKVIGTSEDPAGVGRYLLRANLGDAAAAGRARRLLDWLRSDLDADAPSAALLIKRAWGDGRAQTVDAIQLAAATLTYDSDADRMIAAAGRCGGPSTDARLVCHEVLARAYRERARWADAAAEYEAALALDPGELANRVYGYAEVLIRCGRFDDADRAVDGVLAAHPDEGALLVTRHSIAIARGDAAETGRRLDALVGGPAVTASMLNSAAWSQLGAGGDVARGLALAHKGVERARRSYAVRNTLAALEAETGDVDRAREDNWDAMALVPSEEPGDADWYVAARIDEQIGQLDDAIAIYRRIAKRDAAPLSIAALAFRRLAAIQRAP